MKDLTYRNTSSGGLRKRKRSSSSSQDASELLVSSLSQNIFYEDFYSLLQSELPRWTRDGLWHETSQKPSDPDLSTTSTTNTLPLPTLYSKLERAYLAVCQLNARMGDDMVRNRIALIQLYREYTEIQQGQRQISPSHRIESTVGRGYASQAIDRILENIHEGWGSLNQRRRAELRAKFHDRKKYGKRWSQLSNALGPGILLICSTKLASAVYVYILPFLALEICSVVGDSSTLSWLIRYLVLSSTEEARQLRLKLSTLLSSGRIS